jgi:uncharacterized protein YodC (DUF2158 family)
VESEDFSVSNMLTSVAKDFKPGDIVRLKSGGPTMTITKVASDKKLVECHWFRARQLERAAFVVESLERKD